MLLPPQPSFLRSPSKYPSRNASMTSLSSSDDYSSRGTSHRTSVDESPRKKSSGGTLKVLGRKLFTRAPAVAPLIASRSHSASSASTSHSPPLTPTTPPIWLPINVNGGGGKDFFADLPPISSRLDEVSPRTLSQPVFSQPPLSPKSAPLPALTDSIIEEEGDSDFLRAVLNFGEDASPISPSSRGGRAAPLPPRSSSLQQLAQLAPRKEDGKIILTSAALTKLTTADDDSDDEYGTDEVVAPAPAPAAFPSSLRRKPAGGLDTPSKRALYTCTLLKVHAHLAATLTTPLPASEGYIKANKDLRFPRSINRSDTLDRHPSTYGFTRSLSAALARTLLMKRLKTQQLPKGEEVEISWFQRRYGTAEIPNEVVVKAMAKRQVSPEALAKAPIDESGGMTRWARRPAFLDRVEIISADEAFVPGRTGETKKSALEFSPRVRALAGIQEERRTKLPGKFRPREGRSAGSEEARPERERRPREAARPPPPWIKSRDLPVATPQRTLSPPAPAAAPAAVASPSRPSPRADSSDEEDLPLASRRETLRIRALESEIEQLKLRQRQQKQQEQNRKLLAEARERRGKTRQSELLAAPNYGAGSLVRQPSKVGLAERGHERKSAMPDLYEAGSRMSVMPHHQQGLYEAGNRMSMMPHQQGLYEAGNRMSVMLHHQQGLYEAGARASMMPHQQGLYEAGSRMSIMPHQSGLYAVPDVSGSRMSMQVPPGYNTLPARVSSRRPLVSLHSYAVPPTPRPTGWHA